MPEMPAVGIVANIDSVSADVRELQRTIGRYPPRVRSEEERDEVYTRWCRTLIAANLLDVRGEQVERKLFLLSELYRQGHNLDVRGAAAEADVTLRRCLELYPRSRACNLTASYFYLSVIRTPTTVEKAQKSLTVLRELAAPGLDDDAEAGFVWLALYREDRAEAARLIERYLAAFPQAERAELFRRILRGEPAVVREIGDP